MLVVQRDPQAIEDAKARALAETQKNFSDEVTKLTASILDPYIEGFSPQEILNWSAKATATAIAMLAPIIVSKGASYERLILAVAGVRGTMQAKIQGATTAEEIALIFATEKVAARELLESLNIAA